MGGEERPQGGAGGNHLDRGREQDAPEFQTALRDAALSISARTEP